MLKKTSISVILVTAIIVLLNLISEQYFFRLDLTEDKQYTLSTATENILEELVEPITVTAYFSEDLPPDIGKVKKDFEDLLIEYNRLSGDNILFTFVNPNADEETEQKAVSAGVRPVLVNVREKDQVKQQKAFLGAVLELGERKEVIPFMQPGSALEYALSTAIKKMAIEDKAIIGIVQGHGEASIEEMTQVEQALGVLYDVETVNLNDSTDIVSTYRSLAIVNPTDSISKASLEKLDAYLEQGGRLFIAIDRVKGELQKASGSSVNTRLESWLEEKGILVENAFLTDANSGSITVQQQQGPFRINTQVPFPYIPIISSFNDHPITKGLEAVAFQFISPVTFSAANDTTLFFTPLATTSDLTGKQNAPVFFDVQKEWNKSDFPLQRIPVAGILEKREGLISKWKIVVVGDGNFPVNGPQGQQQQLSPDQVNLMVNAIDWLSDDTGLIDLRTKGITYRPIENLEDGTKSMLKYLNFLLPIVLLSAYGLFRHQKNRLKRVKRMEEDYV